MKGEVFRIFLIISLVIGTAAMAGLVEASPEPVISVDPNRVEDIWLGESFTVDIRIADITEEESLYGWDFGIGFDSSILNAISIEEGLFLKTGGSTTITKYINNDVFPGNKTGVVGAFCNILGYPSTGAYGSGILASIAFQVMAKGKTHLPMYSSKLANYNGSEYVLMEHTPVDGFFTNLHDVAITDVAANTTEVDLGKSVSIDVTVANEGDFPETFDVTTHWNIGALSGLIGTKTVENLENGTSTALKFTWGTTVVSTGTGTGDYTIYANATAVPHEVDTDDNAFTDGEVTVTKTGAPVANFTYLPSEPTLDERVTFNASGSYDFDGGNITSWEWNFDDGNTGTGEEVNYTFTEIGTRRVTLTVEDDSGIRNTVWKLVEVRGPPVAFFTYSPESPLINWPVTFNASLSDPKGGYITDYTWDFGDDAGGNGEIVTHNYTVAGTYIVNLTITDSEGLSDFTAQSVEAKTKHDVAVVSVSRPIQYVGPRWAGNPLKLQVVLKNEGTYEETFNLTLHYDDTPIFPPLEFTLTPFQAKTWTSDEWNAPLSEGNYTIKAQVILADENLINNEATTTIEVNVRNVAITSVTVSSTTVFAGDILNVTVTVKNEGTDIETGTINVVKVKAENSTGSFKICDSKSIPSLQPGATQPVSFLWNATKEGFSPGNYTILATVDPLQGENNFDDNNATYGTVTVGASAISISASLISLTVGKSTAINGSITPVRPNVSVTIRYRLAGEETWDIIETVTTDENSTYLYEWTPEVAGTYEFMASWEGDEKALPSASELLTIKVKEPSSNIVLYAAVVAVAIVAATVAIYFLKIRKTKPT